MTPTYELKPRELAMILGLVDGASTKEIAAEFGITSHLVNNTLSRIRARFGAANNEQLIAILIRQRVLQ